MKYKLDIYEPGSGSVKPLDTMVLDDLAGALDQWLKLSAQGRAVRLTIVGQPD